MKDIWACTLIGIEFDCDTEECIKGGDKTKCGYWKRFTEATEGQNLTDSTERPGSVTDFLELFVCGLIDKHEGQEISELFLTHYYADFLVAHGFAKRK